MQQLRRLGKLAVVLLGIGLISRTLCLAQVPTEGLLHYWPDPAEAVDQVTGRRGIQHGFGPVSSAPEARFGLAAGWVELGPGITNRTFTLSFWMRSGLKPLFEGQTLGQDLLGDGWSIHHFGAGPGIKFSSHIFGPVPRETLDWEMSSQWQAVAVRVNPRPEVSIWVDGVRTAVSSFAPKTSDAPGPLCVGNCLIGNAPREGDLRDLRIYDRSLTDTEIQRLVRELPSAARATWPAATTIPVSEVDLPSAKPSDYRLRHFTTDHGLPSSEVQCVTQARNGALWLGFEAGLLRFDGQRFELTGGEAPEFALSGPDVGALGEGASGELWLGLFGGLVQRGSAGWHSYTNLAENRFVRRVLPAADGTVWFAGARDVDPRGPFRLRRLDPRSGRLLLDVRVPGQVRDLRPANQGLWIATEEPAALWHFNETDGELTLAVHLAAEAAKPPLDVADQPLVRVSDSAARNGIRAEAWKQRAGPLQWVEVRLPGQEQALYWSRLLTRRPFWRLSEVSTDTSTPDWIATPAGLLHRDGGVWRKVPLGRSPTPLTFISPNTEGGIWATTESDGLWLVQPRVVRMLGAEEGLSQGAVTVLRLDNGKLRAGLTGNSAAEIDSVGIRTFPIDFYPPTGSGILVTQSPDGAIYLKDRQGWYFARHSEDFPKWGFATPNGVADLRDSSQIHAARDGSVWLVSADGVYQAREFPPPPEPGGVARLTPAQYRAWLTDLPAPACPMGVAESPDGTMWIGSGGMGLFQIQNGEVRHFPDPRALAHNPCIPLGFAADGTLWVGSEAGLGAFRDGKFHWIEPVAGLPEPVVTDVEEVDGYVWMVGRRGIHAIPRQQIDDVIAGRRPRVQALSLSQADGLLSTETNPRMQPAMARSDQGELWVATAGGVVYLHPARVLDVLRPPPVAIEELVATGRPLPLAAETKVVALAAGEGRVVELRFSSLSFVAPERITFQYRLTGPGSEFEQETTQPHVYFTHLRPGRHVFTVAARSSHGLVSDPPARLEFDLEPYVYQTPLFLVGVTVAGLGAAGSWLTLRFRRMRRLAALEQQQRLNAERQRIAHDMHDDLGAELLLLALKAEKQDDAPAGTGNGSPVPASVRDLQRSLDAAVWTVNPAKDRLDSLVSYLATWVRDFFSGTPIVATVDLPAEVTDRVVFAEWRRQVFLMVKESCVNVLKHSGATRVEFILTLRSPDGPLELRLRDNGRGFDATTAEADTDRLGGNGLTNLRRRAASVRAELRWEATAGGGTTVVLVAPLPGKAA